MVGRKKKTKICDKGSHEEDTLSQLPEHLISEILYHLSTKDAVRTSVLSTKWRYLWQSVPGLDLHSYTFPNFHAFVRFAERFCDPQRVSWIRKLRLSVDDTYGKYDAFPTRWIDVVTRGRIQHIDLSFDIYYHPDKIPPLSFYTCETLVHLRLCGATLVNAEFVSLPCLKIIHLDHVIYPNESTLEKLISGSPVLEDLTIIRYRLDNAKVLQVRSQTLKRIIIDQFRVMIDAPLLQFLRTKIDSTKNFEIINLGFSTKLDIDALYSYVICSESMIHDILTDISRVRDVAISNVFWKEIFQYSKSGPVLQFRGLSRLNARFSKSDLELLPTILESCPKLESLTLELVEERYLRRKKKEELKVTFSTVPQCLVSSLKFVEWKRSISGYEREIELIRYFLKNSTMLEKLRIDNIYNTKKAKCDFLTVLVAIPRCSTACEVIVL